MPPSDSCHTVVSDMNKPEYEGIGECMTAEQQGEISDILVGCSAKERCLLIIGHAAVWRVCERGWVSGWLMPAPSQKCSQTTVTKMFIRLQGCSTIHRKANRSFPECFLSKCV